VALLAERAMFNWITIALEFAAKIFVIALAFLALMFDDFDVV